MQDFAAIDFETANQYRTSVCSVGVVMYRDGRKVDAFYSLIKPTPNFYTRWSTQIHGLTREDTDGAPLFPEVWARIAPRVVNLPFVAHNRAFDENCLKDVFSHYGMEYAYDPFYCTLIQSRRVWPGVRHNLDVIASLCGYNLKHHHHALADAEACAAIALRIL